MSGYKFENITKNIEADYAMEYRQGYTTPTVYVCSQYESGKLNGYKVTLIKGNYTGLIRKGLIKLKI